MLEFIGAVMALLAIIGVLAYVAWRIVREWQQVRRYRYTLPIGMVKADILRRAPYEYGRFQGEDGYWVWHKKSKVRVHRADTREEAEDWIVRQYMSELSHKQYDGE